MCIRDSFDTDRAAVAAQLGFAGVAENSIDAVSNRDFVLDYLGAAATPVASSSCSARPTSCRWARARWPA